MKTFLIFFLVLGVQAAFSKEIKYSCANKSINENESYYLSKYFVTVDTDLKIATFIDKDGLDAAEGEVSLKLFKTNDLRLKGSYKGTLWSDGGCSVDGYITKEMFAGRNQAFLKLKQESECRASGVWLSCFKL